MTLTGGIFLHYEYFKYISIIILAYFFLADIVNAGLLLVIEYFYIAVLLLLLRDPFQKCCKTYKNARESYFVSDMLSV